MSTNRIIQGLLLAAACALAASPAAAQSEDEQILQEDTPRGGTSMPPPEDDEELSTTYSNIGLQKVSADFDNVDDAINLDITLLGIRVPTVPWFGVELNLGFTVAPGQVTEVTPGSQGTPTGCGPLGLDPCPGTGSSTRSSGDFTSTTIGVFAVARSPGKFFVGGKYGYRYINTSLEALVDERSGNAWGASVGYRWNRKGSFVELGYTDWTEDLNSVGLLISYSYNRR